MKWLDVGASSWWDYFIEANLMIGLFNLIPVMPLDGGKVMQSLLGYLLSYHNAIVYSVWISMILSLVYHCHGDYPTVSADICRSISLVIGCFLLVSNWYAYRQLPYHFLRFLMGRGFRVSQLLSRGTIAQPIVITKQLTMAETLKLFMREKYHLIYIVERSGAHPSRIA